MHPAAQPGVPEGVQDVPVGIIGALIIRVGFWGPLCYILKKEPQNSIANYQGSYIRVFLLGLGWRRAQRSGSGPMGFASRP